MRFSFDTTIERGDDEIELRVVYDVSPYVPARLYGDYPQPAEGGEVEVISVKHDGKEIVLTDDEEAALQAACEERAPQDMEDERAAREDWKCQEWRDRLLMRQINREWGV